MNDTMINCHNDVTILIKYVWDKLRNKSIFRNVTNRAKMWVGKSSFASHNSICRLSDIIKTTRNSKSAAFPIGILSSSTCLLHKKVYLSADKMSSDRISSRIPVRKKQNSDRNSSQYKVADFN